MKKMICVILLIALMAGMLSACSVFKCDICRKTKFGDPNELFGLTYCDDCKEDIYDVVDMVGDWF